VKLSIVRVCCICLAAMGSMVCVAQTNPAQNNPLMVTRLYTGTDGQSHFDQIAVPLKSTTESPLVYRGVGQSANNAYLVVGKSGLFENWHNADHKRYIVVVSGKAEVTTTDGEKVVISPGHVYLADDLTGKGHTFRVIGKQNWVALFVDLQQAK
jgi:quercetin dioxygenase-like cupin family protein